MPVSPELRIELIRHARNQIGKPDQTAMDMLVVQMADELDQRVGPNYPTDFNPAYETTAYDAPEEGDGETTRPTLPVQQGSPAAGDPDPAQSYGPDGEKMPEHPEPNV